jgi:hypothetical protein
MPTSMSTATIYARVPVTLKKATEDYAGQHASGRSEKPKVNVKVNTSGSEARQ